MFMYVVNILLHLRFLLHVMLCITFSVASVVVYASKPNQTSNLLMLRAAQKKPDNFDETLQVKAQLGKYFV